MKVVFVASGNKRVGTVSSFVRSQYESLKEEGLEMILFPITGKGWKSYADAIKRLRILVKQESPDIIHAHYSVCGYVAYLASLFTKTKVVVSILGSFPKKTFKLRLVRFCIKHLWDRTIVKSNRTANQLGMDLPVIPNGVNLDMFQLIDQKEARKQCGFEDGKQYVIWCSNPSRIEKRYNLAQKAVNYLNDDCVVLYPIFDRPHDEVVKYMCAADVLLMTSFSEGSPNVIKEAMSCNCPIVSTDVGDVKERLAELDGCYVAELEPTYSNLEPEAEMLSLDLKKALDFGRRTKGREQILEDGITTIQIAEKIINIYKDICHYTIF